MTPVQRAPEHVPGDHPDDVIASKVGPVMRTLLEQVAGTPSPSPAVNPQTADVLLARAQAGTCAGCHHSACRRQGLGPRSRGPHRCCWRPGGDDWPAVASRRLRSRPRSRPRAVAGARGSLPAGPPLHPRPPPLPATPPAPAVAAADAESRRPWRLRKFRRPQCQLHALRRRDRRGLRRHARAKRRRGRACSCRGGAGGGDRSARPGGAGRAPAEVHEAIAEARRVEQNSPGAFVEVRRPH